MPRVSFTISRASILLAAAFSFRCIDLTGAVTSLRLGVS
jgi:hypothetical protein